MKDRPLPGDNLSQASFGYTLTMWIRNSGNQSYSKNIADGRVNHHFFELSESFALWWDSPDSFRIYIYAVDDPYEV